MKTINNATVSFTPSTRTLDFSAQSGFDVRNLYAVIDVDAKAVIYATGTPGAGYSAISGGNVLTLQYDTTALSGSDRLQVIYEDTSTANLTSIVSNTNPQSALTGSFSALNAALTIAPAGYYQSFFISVQGTWNGTISFEHTTDGTNYLATGTAFTYVNGTTANSTTTNGTWTLLNAGYQGVRIRMSAYTSGTATVVLSASNALNTVFVRNATAANLQATVTGTVGLVGGTQNIGYTSVQIPAQINDVTSGAITSTTTTAAFTPTAGTSYSVVIPVTAVSGTTPTMSVQVQESYDGGTSWYTAYTFTTITAVGTYFSPVLVATGNRVRYVQTVGGTTPSFTRTIIRMQSNQSSYAVPTGTTYTDRSGTITTASTSQVVAAVNPQRRYLIFQNLHASAAMFINFTSNATGAQGSIQVNANGGSYTMENSTISTEQVSVFCATASAPFTCKEG